ncbi:MAG: DUF1992 domain-containing protein [Acidobacteriota bacterium]|nr:DUF1992 domain-containing protein [Acidobacteriota bacterium]
MLFLHRLAEKKIREAASDGAFDNLKGKGKPLDLEDDSGVPESLRMAYKIMKNADLVPPEIELRKEKLTLEQLIACCEDPEERKRLRTRLSLKALQLELAMDRGKIKLGSDYRSAVYRKLKLQG